jgi:Divergent InlB B-repeat domain
VHNFCTRFQVGPSTFPALMKDLESSRRVRGAFLLLPLLLLALLAIPASASAGFNDDLADSVAHPEGTSGKDWIETFPANLGPATKETGEPNHAGYAGGHSVWISWQFNEDTDARASACGAKGADLLIAVYTGSAVNELTEVASQGEETAAGCAVVRFDAEEGATYRIAVDAKSSPGTTAMSFYMGRYPPNDDFADAIVLPEFPTTVHVDPGFASLEPGEPPAAPHSSGNSAWYRWTAGKSGPVSINNCDNWPRLTATVFTGPGLGELTQIAEPAINGGICDETRFEAEEGTTYSIRVEGSTGKGDKMTVDFGWVGKTLLTVSKSGSGSGTVVSEPAGIECGGSCEASFYRGLLDYGGIPIELTATSDPGSVFVGWSGEGWFGETWSVQGWGEPKCGSEAVCEFQMFGTPTEVTAEFEELPSLSGPDVPGSELPGSDLPNSDLPGNAAAATAPTTAVAPPEPPAAPLQASPDPKRAKAKCGKKKKRAKAGRRHARRCVKR